MGEGGALLIQQPEDVELAEIIREKGTDRTKFFRGQVDKYTWVEAGSSYLPSELNAAYLWAQLEQADAINEYRLRAWNTYWDAFQDLRQKGVVELPYIPEECKHNAHMFYLKVQNLEERTRLLAYLKEHGICAVFHYVPLHTSAAGIRFGSFHGEDRYTTKESERLLRLPMFYGLSAEQQEIVIQAVHSFFQ